MYYVRGIKFIRSEYFLEFPISISYFNFRTDMSNEKSESEIRIPNTLLAQFARLNSPSSPEHHFLLFAAPATHSNLSSSALSKEESNVKSKDEGSK